MTYVLNDTTILPQAQATRTAPASVSSTGPGFWQRLYAAMIESRRRSAIRELRAHHFRINESAMLLGGIPASTVSNDQALPFNR